MSYFLLCFELLPPTPIHLLYVRSPPEGGKLFSSHTQGISVAAACTSHAVCWQQVTVYTDLFSICAVCETLLRGAIRNKTKRKEESQTCSFSDCNLFLSGLFHSLNCCKAHFLVYIFDWAHLCTVHCLFSGHDTSICGFKDLLNLFLPYLLLLLTPESCTPGASVTRKGWKHLRPGGSVAWCRQQSQQVNGTCDCQEFPKEGRAQPQAGNPSLLGTHLQQGQQGSWESRGCWFSAHRCPLSSREGQELQHRLCLFLCISPSNILTFCSQLPAPSADHFLRSWNTWRQFAS